MTPARAVSLVLRHVWFGEIIRRTGLFHERFALCIRENSSE